MQEPDSDVDRLSKDYPATATDFAGSGMLCVYKLGQEWRVAPPGAPFIVREPRTVSELMSREEWFPLSGRIHKTLPYFDVDWRTMDAFAYANEGEVKPFAPLVLLIGVPPRSLAFEQATEAADAIAAILSPTPYEKMEIAFTEITYSRLTSKVLSPRLQESHLLRLQKPFTPLLGLPISPRKFPQYQATGGFYMQLDRKEPGKGRVVLATVAHGARPPPKSDNVTTTRTNTSQPRQEMVLLGDLAYKKAKDSLLSASSDRGSEIRRLQDRLEKITTGSNAEDSKAVKTHRKKLADAQEEKEDIDQLDKKEIGEYFSTLAKRVIGSLLHSEAIAVSAEPHRFTRDWSLIELDNSKIDWDTFPGNKIYIGDLSAGEFENAMFPRAEDRAGYHHPDFDLLQAYGVVKADEIRNPSHLDIHGEPCLLVVKHGATTGTTTGRVNGLESFTRHFNDYQIEEISSELAVIQHPPKPNHRQGFSDAGDSGSIVVDRDGRLVGMITGGKNTQSGRTDVTYLTPYWWLEQDIKAKFPTAALYPVVQPYPPTL